MKKKNSYRVRMHCDGFDFSVGAKQALENGGQRPPEQRQADDEDCVRSRHGQRAAAAAAVAAAAGFPSAVIRCLFAAFSVVVVPVNLDVQVRLAGRVSREADGKEEEARREGERRCRSHFALDEKRNAPRASRERERESSEARERERGQNEEKFFEVLPSVRPPCLRLTSFFFFFLFFSFRFQNPAMAEPPGLQQPPRDAHVRTDTVMSSGGELQQQPGQQPQQPQQQQHEKLAPSETVAPQIADASPAGTLSDNALPPPPPPAALLPPRDTTVATSEEENLAPVRLTASTSREENSPAPQRLVSTIIANDPSSSSMRAAAAATPPPSTPGSGAAKPSFAGGFGPSVERGLIASSEDYEEAPLLPRGTRIFVRGNNRTRAAFIGKSGTVRTAVGLGGWHLLVRWLL